MIYSLLVILFPTPEKCDGSLPLATRRLFIIVIVIASIIATSEFSEGVEVLLS